jgi:hypothetical protein
LSGDPAVVCVDDDTIGAVRGRGDEDRVGLVALEQRASPVADKRERRLGQGVEAVTLHHAIVVGGVPTRMELHRITPFRGSRAQAVLASNGVLDEVLLAI